MAGVFIKWGKFGHRHVCAQEKCPIKIGVMLPQPRNYLKLGQRPETDPFLAFSEEA